jgi:hypothetical protein
VALFPRVGTKYTWNVYSPAIGVPGKLYRRSPVESFAFRAGERLHAENAQKFTLESARRLFGEAGWTGEED